MSGHSVYPQHYLRRMGYFYLVILWSIWCGLHSMLISLTVTDWLRKRFPDGFRFYRIAYNLFALVTVVPVLRYAASLRTDPVIVWGGPWRPVPVLLGLGALFFFIAGSRRYDSLQFFGIRQLKGENARSGLASDGRLDTGGILSIVRHPWYSAGILLVWIRPMDMAAILSNLVICGYFMIGAWLEERKLRQRFGRQYVAYQQRVSMFFPFKWARRKILQKD